MKGQQYFLSSRLDSKDIDSWRQVVAVGSAIMNGSENFLTSTESVKMPESA